MGGGILILLLILYVLNQFLGKENFVQIPNCAQVIDINQKQPTNTTGKKPTGSVKKKEPEYRCKYCKTGFILKDNQCNSPSIANCPYKDRGKCVQECNQGYNNIYVNTEDNIQKCVASRPTDTYEYDDPIDNNKKYIEINKKYIYLDPEDNNKKIKYVDSCPENFPYIYVDPKDNIQKCVANQPSNTYEYTDIIDNNRKKYINDENYNIYEDPKYNKIKYVKSCPNDTFIYYMDNNQTQRKCVKTCPKYHKSFSTDKNQRCNNDRIDGGLKDDFCNNDSDCNISYYCNNKKCDRGIQKAGKSCNRDGNCHKFFDCKINDRNKGICSLNDERLCTHYGRTVGDNGYEKIAAVPDTPNIKTDGYNLASCNETLAESKDREKCHDKKRRECETEVMMVWNWIRPNTPTANSYKNCMKKKNCQKYDQLK